MSNQDGPPTIVAERATKPPRDAAMKAARLHAIGDLRVESVPVPQVADGEALVQIAYSGICGSDISRVLTKGTYSFPTIPGHEFSGTVVDCPSDPTRVGDRVAVFPLIPCGDCAMCAVGEYAACANYDYYGSRRDGGFGAYQSVRLENLIALPDNVSLEAGAMVEPAAVAVHAIAAAPIQLGDSVAVVGAGPIGLMAAQLAAARGAEVYLVDLDRRKLELAEAHGWARGVLAGEQDAAEAIRGATGGGVHVAIEAAGVSSTLATCLRGVRPFGHVVLLGNPAGAMNLQQDDYWQILRKQLTCVGVWNSSHNPVRDDWRVAVEAMARGDLDPEPLITHRFQLDQANEAFRVAVDHDELSIKIMFTPGDTR